MGVLRLKVGGVYTDIVQGPAGPIGPQGPQGIQGATGAAGSDAASKMDIISSILLASTAAQVDFTGLNNATYPTMKLLATVPNAAAGVPRIRFNGITTSTYNYGYSYVGYSGTNSANQAGIAMDITGNTQPFSIDVTFDATKGRAFGLCFGSYQQGQTFFGEESTRPAITSISLFRDGAVVWPVGSRFTLYGYKVA